MPVIEGKAKRYNDTPVDYISIFNWVDGKCITQVVPDSAGNWYYYHYKNINIGITYVADGCEPITHGPYVFDVDFLTGFLLLSVSHSNGYLDRYDSTATSGEYWAEYFKDLKDIAALDYSYSKTSSGLSTNTPTKTINLFDRSWVLSIYGWNATTNADSHRWTFEVLDNNNNTLFALKSEKDASRSSGLWYGTNLQSMVKAINAGGNVSTNGELSFTNTQVKFTNARQDSATYKYNQDFMFNVDLRSASKIRVSASSSGTSGVVGGYIRITKPTE